MNATTTELTAAIPEAFAGDRLDQALAKLFPDYSRSRLQQWIRAGQIQVNGQSRRPRDRVQGGENVVLRVTPEEETAWRPQAIALDILYEDASLLVVNKPSGLVVHPAAGNPDGTLVNALLHHAPELAQLPRAGIVHRLDKETTGLVVVARNLSAHKALVEQLQGRTIKREYEAVVVGVMPSGGTVDQPIARHPVDRKRMTVWPDGKPAVTHYRVKQRFCAHTHLQLQLETGRTHQIRVHMTHIRYPIVGDPVYGGRLRIPRSASDALVQVLRNFRRQALHARRLELAHPASGEWMQWQAPTPDDLASLLQVLRDDSGAE